jgi:hypothetical protein
MANARAAPTVAVMSETLEIIVSPLLLLVAF